MATLVFVPGIGVRNESYPAVWPQFRRELSAIRPTLPAEICAWGVAHGARQASTGTPTKPVEAAADPTSGGDPGEAGSVALWQQLYQEPSWELDLLAIEIGQVPVVARIPGAPRPGADLTGRIEELGSRMARWQQPPGVEPGAGRQDSASDPLYQDLAAIGLESEIGPAAARMAAHHSTVVCVRREDALGGRVRPALARAILAEAVRRAGGAGATVVTGDDTDRIVARLTSALGGQPMGPRGWLVGLALRLVRPHVEEALRPVTWLAAGAREQLTPHATRYAGDVLRYLSRGETIRAAVADFVARKEPPVVLVGHSLGGTICFDLLAAKQVTGVQLLVTVGAQVPYFYDIDVLPGHRRDVDALPDLPRWINVHDRRDLLSFPAAPVLPADVVVDHQVDSRAPFPMSHVAYFRQPEFYRLLGEVLP